MRETERHTPVRSKGEDIDYKLYYSREWLRLEGRVLAFFVIVWFIGWSGILS